MSSQNPVFIPGPTNIPERLRHACNVPTIDHRSSSFGTMFKPLFAGVKEVLKTTVGRGHHVPGQRHRRLGGGDLQHAVAGRQGSRLPPRHVLAPLDRHVQAARARRRPAQRPVGRRRARGRLPGRARGGQGPRDQGRPRHPQRDRHRRPLRRRRHPPRDGRGEAPGAAPRRRRQLDRLDGLPHGRVGRRRRRHRQPEGLHAADRPRHRRRQPEGARRDGDREAAALLPRLPRHARTPTRRAASPTRRRSTSSTASASR